VTGQLYKGTVVVPATEKYKALVRSSTPSFTTTTTSQPPPPSLLSITVLLVSYYYLLTPIIVILLTSNTRMYGTGATFNIEMMLSGKVISLGKFIVMGLKRLSIRMQMAKGEMRNHSRQRVCKI